MINKIIFCNLVLAILSFMPLDAKASSNAKEYSPKEPYVINAMVDTWIQITTSKGVSYVVESARKQHFQESDYPLKVIFYGIVCTNTPSVTINTPGCDTVGGNAEPYSSCEMTSTNWCDFK